MNPILFPLTVVIPTYNRSTLLIHTLDSLASQTLEKSSFEVIVVDDGSSDNTEELVRSYNKLNISYFFQEDQGYRVASARNIGIENASGNVVLFIDSGLVLGSTCLASHLEHHTEEDIAVLGYIYGIDGEDLSKNITAEDIDLSHPNGSIAHFHRDGKFLDLREEVFSLCGDNLSDLPAPWAMCWTGNLSVKKKSLDQIGNFDSHFDGRWGMEDIDLGYRLFNQGVKFKLSRDASSIHYPHENDSVAKFNEESFNKEYFYAKYPTPETLELLNLSHSIELNAILLGKNS